MTEQPDKGPSVTETHAEDLGPLAYAKKQLVQWGISVAGIAAGAAAGVGIGKALFKQNEFRTPVEIKFKGIGTSFINKKQAYSAAAGAMIGSIISSVALSYGHWVKVRKEQLAVDDMFSKMENMKLFKQPSEEVAKENQQLRAMLTQAEQENAALSGGRSSAAQSILDAGSKTPMDQATRSPAAQQAAR